MNNIYRLITQDNALELTSELKQFLLNVNNLKDINIKKNIYTYDDINDIFNKEGLLMNKSMVKKYLHYTLPYVINPYLVNNFDTF